MEFLGGEFQFEVLAEWWDLIIAYASTRWLPTIGIAAIALVAYLPGGWILRWLRRRVATKTTTDLDDALLRAIRKMFRITVVAWAAWRLADTWIGILGTETAEAGWVPFDKQPSDWIWGIWIGIVFVPVSGLVGHMVRSLGSRADPDSRTALDETVLPMVNRFARLAVVALGILLALTHLGLEIAPLLAGAGVVGLALSLAAKDTLSNLIAGVLLVIDRPFKVGDRIELWSAPRETGSWGDVIDIGLRATKIRNPDNLVIVVPNNEIMQRDIINYTMSGGDIRLRIPFSCTDKGIEIGKHLVLKVAQQVQGVKLDPAPVVIVRSYGPSQVNLELRVWITEARERRRIGDEITEKAILAFTEAGVEIPYPKRDLYIKQDGAAQ
ncbi:MAG: mechanosensitive ion channel [Bacteroidota bacterium]|nr:mechanosensitive ion channel [Bacteroidota bacterium]MDE2834052.1 mechanosensitive ion channel [Bacteroidota bacterium]MDE2957477.1 mechanosensitive ion channel [Bacteroidota bacterium]